MNPTLDYTVSGDPTKDAINKKRAESVAAGLDPSANAVSVPATGTTAITAASLAPAKPYSVPQAQVSTNAEGLTGEISALAEAQRKQAETQAALEAKAEAAKTEKTNWKEKLLQDMRSAVGIQAQRPELEKAQDIDQKAQDVTTYTNEIEAMQRAQQNEIKALDSQPITLQDKAQRVADINNKYASRLADKAILLNAANRNLATAQSIVDRKIEIQLEPLKTQMDFTKMFYEENKDLFDKADQRAFENVIRQDERAYTEERDRTKSLEKAKLEAIVEAQTNGAPIDILNAIQRAETPEAAFAAAGRYIGLIDRQYKLAQIGKLNAEANDNGTVTLTRYDENGNPIPPGAKEKALEVILGSGKFTKDQKNAVVNAINNGEDPVTVIKNQAKNIMGATEAGKVANYEIAQAAMSDIDSALTQFYAKGGKTNIFSGSYEKTINKLGEVDKPELVELATQIASSLQVYRNAVSGTAYSVQEGKEIANVFPGINKSQGLNKAIISGRMKAFDSTIDGAYRTVLGSSYDELTKNEKKIEANTSDPLGLGISSTTKTSTNPLGI